MKKSKLYTILIAVAFALIICLSFVCLLIVKRIDITYVVSEESEVSYFDKKINDKFKGKLLFFINENNVKKEVEEDSYFSFIKLDKHFPNYVNLKVEMRRETYSLNVGGDSYILDKDGIVLSKNCNRKQTFELIDLSIEGVEFNGIKIGEKIETNRNELFYNVLDMAKAVNLSDNIKSIRVESMAFDIASVLFKTHTGVEIDVFNPFDKGVEKTVFAFDSYDDKADDYEKTYSTISVYIENGELKTTWTERG